MKAKADVNLCTLEDNQTPLTLALTHNNVGEEVIDRLLDACDIRMYFYAKKNLVNKLCRIFTGKLSDFYRKIVGF